MERALQAGADPQGAGDHSKTATLLRLVLLWGLVIGVAAAAGHALILGPTGVVMAVYPVVFAAFVALLLLLRGGHVQATGLGLLLLVWAAVIASALTDGGLFGVAISGFTIVIVGATLLFDRRLVLASLALCFAAQVGFLALALLGLTPAATTPDTPGQAFLARAIHLSAAGMFLYLAMRSLQHARQRARDNDSRAAELLREATSARNYADNILTAMAESLIVIDAAGAIETVNKATLELLGHERDALVGRPFKTLLPDLGDHPGDRPSGRPNEQHEAIERSYLHRDGHAVAVLLTRSPLHGEAGRKGGSVWVASDITRLKHAEQSLREAKQQAEEASLAKSRFLANMSHELRTPLNAVIGYAEMLLEEVDERALAGSTDELRKVQSAGKHLLGLISDILDLSKIEAGRMDIHMETFDVADMIETVLGTVRPMLARNRNELAVSCPPTIGFIHADLTKIRQILLNLLSNAAKFTEHGTVRLSASRSPGRIQFQVADTGTGMTQAQLGQLFQAFSQADTATARRFGGTGLGLAISKAFVDMLGGSIEVQSRPGVGTTFTVRLSFVDPLDLSMSKRPPGLSQALALARKGS
jgi:PAS domain S-box-containing protein